MVVRSYHHMGVWGDDRTRPQTIYMTWSLPSRSNPLVCFLARSKAAHRTRACFQQESHLKIQRGRTACALRALEERPQTHIRSSPLFGKQEPQDRLELVFSRVSSGDVSLEECRLAIALHGAASWPALLVLGVLREYVLILVFSRVSSRDISLNPIQVATAPCRTNQDDQSAASG